MERANLSFAPFVSSVYFVRFVSLTIMRPAIIALVLLFFAFPVVNQQRNTPNNASGGDQHSSSGTSTTQGAYQQAQVAPSGSKQNKSYFDEAKSPQNAPNWIMAGLTLLGVLLGLSSLYFVWRQSVISQAAADVASANAQSIKYSERAELAATVEFLPGFGLADRGVCIRVYLGNNGRTTAWIDSARIGLYVVNPGERLPVPPDWVNTERLEFPIASLSSGEKTVSKDMTIVTQKPETSFDSYKVIFGRVQYRDVFRDQREREFAYKIGLSGNLVQINEPGYSKNA